MGQRQVSQSSLSGFIGLVAIIGNNGNYADQATDVFFGDAALPGRPAPGIISEEITVAFLDIRIPMVAGSRHERNVFVQIIIRIVCAPFVERFNYQVTELYIQGVLSRP
jgi:hypothetical protein